MMSEEGERRAMAGQATSAILESLAVVINSSLLDRNIM
jgi:hypothetical protein